MPARPRPAPLPSFAAASKASWRPAAGSTRAAGSSAPAATSASSTAGSRCGWRSPRARCTRARSSAAQILQIDERGRRVRQDAAAGRRPRRSCTWRSSRRRGAGAVLHTHSVWSTMLSERSRRAGRGLAIEGFEMLKGLDGVTTHEHREWIPIVTTIRTCRGWRRSWRRCSREQPDAHAFLLGATACTRGAATLADAERHVEILEFLFETIGRREAASGCRSRKRGHHGALEDS